MHYSSPVDHVKSDTFTESSLRQKQQGRAGRFYFLWHFPMFSDVAWIDPSKFKLKILCQLSPNGFERSDNVFPFRCIAGKARCPNVLTLMWRVVPLWHNGVLSLNARCHRRHLSPSSQRNGSGGNEEIHPGTGLPTHTLQKFFLPAGVPRTTTTRGLAYSSDPVCSKTCVRLKKKKWKWNNFYQLSLCRLVANESKQIKVGDKLSSSSQIFITLSPTEPIWRRNNINFAYKNTVPNFMVEETVQRNHHRYKLADFFFLFMFVPATEIESPLLIPNQSQ